MPLRHTLGTAAVTIVLWSSSLFAAEPASVRKPPPSLLEISSSSTQQASPEVSCELKIKERYEYYDVNGGSIGDLQKQIKENGTKWNDGKTYAAVTNWDIRYDYDVLNDNGRCSVKSAKTDVSIVYHLPRRIISPSSASLAPVWDDYMAHVKVHEFGHKDIAVKTAGEINEALASLGSFPSKKELEREAKRVVNEKLQQMKDAQVAYDARTRHGETQGAILSAKDH